MRKIISLSVLVCGLVTVNFFYGFRPISGRGGLNPDVRMAEPKSKEMIAVAGGKFMMGAAEGEGDEKPMHEIELSDFSIDKYEVTNAEYAEFLNANGNKIEGGSNWLETNDEDCGISVSGERFSAKKGQESRPVVMVSWYGATAYAKWAGKRLPTEAEWEYAARGGQRSKGTKFSGGAAPNNVGWFDGNAAEHPWPVGSKTANELGIYDMSGNVWEWCSDWYKADYYKVSPKKNPTGPPQKMEYKVLRGGAWVSIAKQLRVTARDFAFPHNNINQNGFRCVK